jgi:fructose-bisphosphate aldolase class II
VVKAAHAKGVTVEGEIGTLGGIEDGHGAGLTAAQAAEHLTDPAQAERFVADTGVDALAVAIGTSHGAYKFSHRPTGDVLRMDRIEEIHRRLPNCHLVMHGSSSVPQELLEIIRRYGGQMKETYGVPVEEIQRGIRHGVRKVNVDTDNRLAMTGAIRKVFAEHPADFDPRKYLSPARDAMKKVCLERMTAFGQAGNAGKIKPITCKQMIAFYAPKPSKKLAKGSKAAKAKPKKAARKKAKKSQR